MEKIGVAICHPTIPYNESFFRDISEAGIHVIEITRYAEDYAGLDYKAISAYAKKYGVGLWSYHLPFYPASMVNITSKDPSVRQRSLEYYTDIIGKAADVGIDKFVVHPINEFIRAEDTNEHIERSRESLCRIADIAEKHGATIAVENLIAGLLGKDIAEMERLLDADDRLRICFDTNHLFGEPHTAFIERFGKRIITIHASDYDFKCEKHWLPGEGDIDWVELKRALDKAGYTGPFMYEASPVAPDTILRERPLEYKDYVENARSIFAEIAPKPFGRRK